MTVAVVLTTLLLAFALSAFSTFQVLDEYRLLGDWLKRQEPVSAADIRELRKDIGGRIIARSSATAVLLLCTLSTLWLQGRQLTISRTLDQVKLLAHDILASLNQGVITTDRNSVITSINPAALRLLEVGPDCLGKPIRSVSSVEVPLDALSRSVTVRGETVSDRELTIDRPGGVRQFLATALELNDTRGANIGCVIHLRDVTDRMLMKEQMWRMQQFASLSTLASGLHHEIKNPIAALSIHVQLLDERLRYTEAADLVAEQVAVLKAEVRRLNNKLESFRDFANLEHLRLEPIDVNELPAEVARLIGPQAEAQGVRLEVRRPEGSTALLSVDPGKLQQALLNLVLNALEAMPGGGVLTLETASTDEVARVLVKDSGPGIPPEIHDMIFHPYFSTKDRGTGIGLAFADKLVRQHRGQLSFRTGPGGTTFTISLPRVAPIRSDVTP